MNQGLDIESLLHHMTLPRASTRRHHAPAIVPARSPATASSPSSPPLARPLVALPSAAPLPGSLHRKFLTSEPTLELHQPPPHGQILALGPPPRDGRVRVRCHAPAPKPVHRDENSFGIFGIPETDFEIFRSDSSVTVFFENRIGFRNFLSESAWCFTDRFLRLPFFVGNYRICVL
jgi:hypothetical protein